MPVSNSLFVTVLATFAGNSFPPRYSIRIGSAIISMTKVQRRRSIAAVRPMERKCSVLPFTKPFQFLFPVFSRFRWSRARYACRILTPLRGTSALSRNSGCSNGADVYDCAVSFGRAYFGLRWQAHRDAAFAFLRFAGIRASNRTLNGLEKIPRRKKRRRRYALPAQSKIRGHVRAQIPQITLRSMPHVDSSPRARGATVRSRGRTWRVAKQVQPHARAVFCLLVEDRSSNSRAPDPIESLRPC